MHVSSSGTYSLRQIPAPLADCGQPVKAPLALALQAALTDWPEFQAWEPGWWRTFRKGPLAARLYLMLKR